MFSSPASTKAVSVILLVFGLTSLRTASRDIYLIFLERVVRTYAYGSSTLVLALLFKALDFSDAQLGAFMTLTLIGDVLISLILTLIADRLGRRRIIALGGFLMLGSGVVFALASNFYVLLLAAIVGVISPSGNEIGPFKAIEDGILAQLALDESRAEIFAISALVGQFGIAIGQLTIGWLSDRLQFSYGWDALSTYRLVFAIYSVCAVIKLAINFLLSPACEVDAGDNYMRVATEEREPLQADDSTLEVDDALQQEPVQEKTASIWVKAKALVPPISPQSRTTVMKLCLLFALDNAASGLVPQTFVIYFFHQKFSLEAGSLGTIFFTTSIISGISSLVAAAVSRLIGLMNTMVFTHLPASMLLAFIPLPSSVGVAIAILVLRNCTVTMDSAPRSAFLAQILLKEEFTSVMGIINVVKTLSQSVGPWITGWLSEQGIFWVSFVVAGVMKVSYDLGLLALFLNMRARGIVKESHKSAAGA